MADGILGISEALHPHGEPPVQELLAALRPTEFGEFALWLAKNITKYIPVGGSYQARISAPKLREAVNTFNYIAQETSEGRGGMTVELCLPCSHYVPPGGGWGPTSPIPGKEGEDKMDQPKSPPMDILSPLSKHGLPALPEDLDVSGVVSPLRLKAHMHSLSSYNLHLVSMVDALENNGGDTTEEEEELFELLEKTVLRLNQCLDRLDVVTANQPSSMHSSKASPNKLKSPEALLNSQENRIKELEGAVKTEVMRRIKQKFGSPGAQ